MSWDDEWSPPGVREPDKEEAELMRQLSALFAQTGGGGAPPEALELVRSHVRRKVAQARGR